jgi:hypothetical protein
MEPAMLDDIRNSSLLVLVSAAAVAVLAIALQPQPPRGGPAHADAKPVATVVATCHTTAMASDRNGDRLARK